MKTIAELIKADHQLTDDTSAEPAEQALHPQNIQMNYNGGRRGRKTEEERQKIVEEYKLKVLKKKITLSFD